MKGHFRRKSLSKSPYSEILKFARKSSGGRKFSILVKTRNRVVTIVSFQSDRGVYNSYFMIYICELYGKKVTFYKCTQCVFLYYVFQLANISVCFNVITIVPQ